VCRSLKENCFHNLPLLYHNLLCNLQQKKSAWSTKENANVDSQPESRPRSRNSACKPPANHIIPTSVNAPIMEHVLVQKEAMQYLSDDFLDCKYFCVEV